jgi:hypothetical protein
LNNLKFASVLFHRGSKFVLLGGTVATLAVGIYLTRGGSVDVLAAPASTSTDTVDQSALTTARRLAAQAHGDAEQEQSTEAVRIADDAVDQAFVAALREATAEMNPLTGEALATSQQIAKLESTVEEEKQHVVALTTARLMTASQNDVAGLGERAQVQLDLDTNKLGELRRDLVLLGGDKQARIQQELDEHDALQEQPVVYSTAESDLESSQKLVTLPGKFRAYFEMRAREKQLRQAAEEATTAAARMSRQKETPDARIKDQQELAAIYGSWAELTEAKRVNVQHGILLALAILGGIFLAVPFGVVLIRRELAGRVRENGRRYPIIAELVVEALALAMILIVIFGTPGHMPSSLG